MKKILYLALLFAFSVNAQLKIKGGAGVDGKSAYELAVDNGFVGNEAAWLASLEGPQGPTGATGPAGLDGAQTWPLYRRAYISAANPHQKAAIDIKNDTITFPSFDTYLWFEDDMESLQLSTTRYVDFSAIPDSRTVVVYYNRTDDVFGVTDEVTELPIGDGKNYYIITTFRKQANTEIVPSANAAAFNISKLSEPSKITVLGDSHTQQGADWEAAIERFFGSNPAKYSGGFVDFVRLGVSGSTVVNNGVNSFYQRRTQIPSDTDMLLIYGGHNDQNASNTIGTLASGSFDDTTFIGAYQAIIEYAYSLDPSMRIGLVIPHRAYASGVERDMSAYNQAIKDVADYYSLPVLDLDAIFQDNIFNYSTYLLDETPNFLHLSDYGKTVLARLIYNFIKDNY